MSTMSKALVGTAVLAAVAALGGCNTVKGVGEDVYAVGDSSQKALNEAYYGDNYDHETRSTYHNRTYYGD